MRRFTRFSKKRGKSGPLFWQKAPDIKKRIVNLVDCLNLTWISTNKIHTYRSSNSSSHTYARIWGLSRIWQLALRIEANYVIEVLSERFDKLPDKEKDKVLLHELAHIPKNFSGSLLPHIRRRGKRNFHDRVDELFAQYLRSLKNL